MRSAVIDLGAQPVENLCPTPRPTVYPSGWNVMNGSLSTGPTGANAVRATANGVGTVYIFTARAPETFSKGEPVTMSAKLLLPVGYNYGFRIHVRSTNSYLSPGTSTTDTATPTDGLWFTTSLTYVLDRDVAATDLDLALILRAPAGGNPPAGTVMTLADPMIQRGTVGHAYADGTFPGWRWAGTAAASKSVGYP